MVYRELSAESLCPASLNEELPRNSVPRWFEEKEMKTIGIPHRSMTIYMVMANIFSLHLTLSLLYYFCERTLLSSKSYLPELACRNRRAWRRE